MEHPTKRSSGFTLVELAIVMVIVALLSAGALTALRVQSERTRTLDAKTMLADAREALLNFAAVTGALPCPDTNDDGDPDSCAAIGVSRGKVPWKALALPGRDPWGQALRYAVHRKFTDAATLTLSTTSALKVQSVGGSGVVVSLANEEAVAMGLWSTGPDATDNTSGGSNSELVAESPGSDDLVTWVSRFILLGRMLEAGRDVPQ